MQNAVNTTLLAVAPRHLSEVTTVMEAVGRGDKAGQAEARERSAAVRRGQAERAGQVAVIKIRGLISHREDSCYAWYGTSMEWLQRAIAAVESNDEIAEVIFDIDSPGGFVGLVGETAEMIRAMKKPTIAVANTMACSAAYDLAAAADELVVTPSGEVASIGVFMVHMEFSAMAEEAGISINVIRFGEHKAEANSYEPLTDDARAHLQEQVDEFGTAFVARVAKHRGVTPAQVRERMGDGRSLTAKQAVKAGAADRIATLEQVLASRGVHRTSLARAEGAPPAIGMAAMGGWNLEWQPIMAPAQVQVLAPVLAAAVADDDEDEDVCPDCGGDMDDGVCPECSPPEAAQDTPAPEAEAAGATVEEATDPPPTEQAQAPPDEPAAQTEENEPDAGGAAATATSDTPATPTATEARRQTMADMEQAPGAGATAVQDAVAAERKRVTDLATLKASHPGKVTDSMLAAWQANPSATYDSASAEVLRMYREEDAARPVLTTTTSGVNVGQDRAAGQGWRSFGEQLQAIVGAAKRPDSIDPRLRVGPSGLGETSGGDAGFLIEPQYADGILTRAHDMGQILSRVQKIPIGANSNGLRIKAVDETSRAGGSRWGGVQTYWVDEADTATASKPKFRIMDLNLKKLMSVYYATDEVLQDATALESICEQAFAEEISFTTEEAVFSGNGSGKPLGVNAEQNLALVTVAKESGQSAATIQTANILKMWARLWSRSRANAVWWINQDIEPQLYPLTLGSGTATTLLYTPPGTRGNEFGLLMGRPVIPVEYAETLGTAGDVMLADMSQYVLIDKGGPNTRDSNAVIQRSMHVRFLYDEQTFKITYRVDGQPAWSAAITPNKGSNTLSPFVRLETRS